MTKFDLMKTVMPKGITISKIELTVLDRRTDETFTENAYFIGVVFDEYHFAQKLDALGYEIVKTGVIESVFGISPKDIYNIAITGAKHD